MFRDKLSDILERNGGIITTKDAQSAGISRPSFMAYVNENGLTRIAHGVYSSDESWPDIFRQLQMQYPSVIFSHESALFLHDLAEREPDPVSVTVKTNYHSASMSRYRLQVYYVNIDLFEIGLTEKFSPTGYRVRCYDVERTICDMIRSYNSVDNQELTAALKAYIRKEDRNIPLLMRYGEKFRITSKLNTYMEVLL